MGILAELVLARPDEAAAVGRTNLPYEAFETLDASGENELTLGALYETLGGPDDADFELLFETDAEGPWVHALPPGLITALAGLDDARLDEVLAAWNAHPEIAALNGPLTPEQLEALQQRLAAICAFSRRALAEGKSLLLWLCL